MGILIIAAIAAGTLGFFAFFEQQIRSYKFDVAAPPMPRSIARGALPSSSQASRAPHPRFIVLVP